MDKQRFLKTKALLEEEGEERDDVFLKCQKHVFNVVVVVVVVLAVVFFISHCPGFIREFYTSRGGEKEEIAARGHLHCICVESTDRQTGRQTKGNF